MRVWVINWSATHRDKYYPIQEGRIPRKQFRKFSCSLPPGMECQAPNLTNTPIAHTDSPTFTSGKRGVYSREATDRELEIIGEVREAEGD